MVDTLMWTHHDASLGVECDLIAWGYINKMCGRNVVRPQEKGQQKSSTYLTPHTMVHVGVWVPRRRPSYFEAGTRRGIASDEQSYARFQPVWGAL